jgi:hypothetical protein
MELLMTSLLIIYVAGAATIIWGIWATAMIEEDE